MYEEAADDFRSVIGKCPNRAFVLSTRSDVLYDQLARSGNWRSDLARQIRPTDSAYYNLAMLLAAGPDDIRDRAEARNRAEKVCELDEARYYAFQEALAAAYAAEHDFENARKCQRRAIALAPDKKLKESLEQNLVRYEEGECCPFFLDLAAN
jgi:tetratricopeptide (TPR) repeat protein